MYPARADVHLVIALAPPLGKLGNYFWRFSLLFIAAAINVAHLGGQSLDIACAARLDVYTDLLRLGFSPMSSARRVELPRHKGRLQNQQVVNLGIEGTLRDEIPFLNRYVRQPRHYLRMYCLEIILSLPCRLVFLPSAE